MDKVYRLYRDSLMNPQRLMDELGMDQEGDSLGMGVIRKELDLTNEEKQYLLAVERGDIPSTRQYLNSMHITNSININCVDPLGRTALLIAIENENVEMIELLLSHNVEIGDALLHAINEENVEAVELILVHQVATKGEESLMTSCPSSSFTPDITPIILAAHRDNYEIIKILLDRGYRIPKPHDVRCSCKLCIAACTDDILRHSRSRINAYRALASPSLICLSSKDPILTSFELSWELRRLSRLENEFKTDYEKLSKKCQDFAVDLLEQTRGSKELEIVLNHDTSNPSEEQGERMKLSRLKLAIKFKQKMFVSHPNCQQLLASMWYAGLPGFRRKNVVCKLVVTFTIGVMFPVLSLVYMIAPQSSIGQLIRKPFVKFICHSASYLTFLFLLILVSQRVEIAHYTKIPDSPYPEPKEPRGAPATTVEWMILVYVAGLIWSEVKELWNEGAKSYIHDMWNILDFATNSLYIATLTLRVISYMQVSKERAEGKRQAYIERHAWDAFDPSLVAETLFAAANIFSSLKLIYIFTVNSHLGPLQISLGRMVMDILKFVFVFLLVLFSFACGLNHLYWYYANLRQQECASNALVDSCDRKYRSFANLFEILQTLYWAIYGLVDLDRAELKEPHVFTELAGKLMFGTYSFITIIVLFNMLIAMMSNSYQTISSQADEEWKFARSKLWISYFEDGGTLPPPFNIIPSPKTIYYMILWLKNTICACSKHQKRSRWQSIKKIVKKINEREVRYQAVMKDLIKRYIMQKQRSPSRGEGVTEDDVNEIKQDISSFRFELLEILRNNGMKTPNPNQPKPTNRRLSRKKSQLSLDRLKRSLSVEPRRKKSSEKLEVEEELPRSMSMRLPDAGNVKVPETIVEESLEMRRQSIGQGLRARKESAHKLVIPKLVTEPAPSREADNGVNKHKVDEGLGESIDQPSVLNADSIPPRRRPIASSSPNLSFLESPKSVPLGRNNSSNGKVVVSKSQNMEAFDPKVLDMTEGNSSKPSHSPTDLESMDPFSKKPMGSVKKVSFLWSEIGKNLKDPKVESYVYDGSMKNPGEIDGKKEST
ncbi:transient receptor potential-gamma protein-like [Liolophura sinensis]|uniref:transient receptor potential-gamma protein-like n=1 Tax=Liolophura sinensis TaxID=3198878 RepID=UPI0031595EEE